MKLPSAKTVTAAAWSVEVKKRSYRTDGAYREVDALIRGAAAGIGRVGERNRRFVGERRRDRLRHNKLLFMCSFPAMVWLVRLGDLTTDCSGASRQRRRYGAIVCPSERKVVVRARREGHSR